MLLNGRYTNNTLENFVKTLPGIADPRENIGKFIYNPDLIV